MTLIAFFDADKSDAIPLLQIGIFACRVISNQNHMKGSTCMNSFDKSRISLEKRCIFFRAIADCTCNNAPDNPGECMYEHGIEPANPMLKCNYYKIPRRKATKNERTNCSYLPFQNECIGKEKGGLTMDIDTTPSQLFVAYHMCDAFAAISCSDGINLRETKLEALKRLDSRLKVYITNHYPMEIINAICVKRIRFIMQAKTAECLSEIMDMKSNYPVYNYGSWRFPPYHLDEEELILWANFSPGVKMVPHASRRYIELGRKYLKGLTI